MKCLDIIGDPMALHHQPSSAVTVVLFRSRLTAMPPQGATTAADDGLAKARLFGGEFVDGPHDGSASGGDAHNKATGPLLDDVVAIWASA
jgi:hypothetical protein